MNTNKEAQILEAVGEVVTALHKIEEAVLELINEKMEKKGDEESAD